MKIVITGFMGSGKTRLARELARRLNLEMVDLDDRVTRREGRSPAQLIVDEGEDAFRSIESDVLRELLDTDGTDVIALGGGAWIVDANRQLIEEYGCLSIWLDVPFEVCWARIETSGDDRPLGRTRDEAKTRYDQRKPIYQLAKIHVEVTGEVDLDSVIARIKNAADKRG
ncbi:MAG TPA: shikimate kinase [Pyrinomonadaceae bacterium]|nr:shikimate kinase [Pyrinomonadaceae bacterium]